MHMLACTLTHTACARRTAKTIEPSYTMIAKKCPAPEPHTKLLDRIVRIYANPTRKQACSATS